MIHTINTAGWGTTGIFVDGVSIPDSGAQQQRSMLAVGPGGRMPDHGVPLIGLRDGRPVFRDLRWGVYVVFEAPSDYVAACFDEYGLLTDASGRYSALWKPYHLIGLELGISVASVALRNEPTGQATGFRADAVATAKRDRAAAAAAAAEERERRERAAREYGSGDEEDRQPSPPAEIRPKSPRPIVLHELAEQQQRAHGVSGHAAGAGRFHAQKKRSHRLQTPSVEQISPRQCCLCC